MRPGPPEAVWGEGPMVLPPPRPPVPMRVAAWLVGLVAGLVVVGPGLRAGSWFNVDLVATPVTPVPRGVWALGPELPRRVPYALPLAWASPLVDSTWVLKAVVVVSIAAAVAGAWLLATRWFPGVALPAALGAGLLYGLSPFLLTRLGVGHIPLVVAMGILPWAVPRLFDPTRHEARTFLWCVALAGTGFLGGILALVAVPLALLAAWPGARRALRAGGLLLVSQLPWLVPGLLVLWQGASPAAAAEFRTSTRGSGGIVRVLAGHGFWRPGSQVGEQQGWIVPLLGVLLVGAAIVGIRRLAPALRRAVLAVGAAGLVVPLASGAPLFRRGYAVLVDTPASSALREGQRLLPLYLVVLAPLVAGGASELARRWPGWREGSLLLAPIAVALTLAGPGLWGIGGALDPVTLPPSWSQARTLIRSEGGTVLSLPFFQYSRLGVADDRSSLDPMPIYLGGDVVSASDPQLSTQALERSDPREEGLARAVERLRTGRPTAADLGARGVHWIIVRHDRDWTSYLSLDSDPGFRRVVRGRELDLYEVLTWRAVAVAADGRPVRVGQVVAPLARVHSEQATDWFRPGVNGWMRGRHGATTTPVGVVGLPEGGGPVWFWPAVVTLVADALVLVAVGVAIRRRSVLTAARIHI